MRDLRAVFAAIVSVSLTVIPACANTTPSVAPLGTVIAAEHAHVGQSVADVGTTVYGGDRLSTEGQGTIQVRAGAARLLLLNSTVAEVNDEEGTPSAKLLMGTATFSTGNAHAFTLYASKASVRANTDADDWPGRVRERQRTGCCSKARLTCGDGWGRHSSG